jgi:copper chaperone CopZ
VPTATRGTRNGRDSPAQWVLPRRRPGVCAVPTHSVHEHGTDWLALISALVVVGLLLFLSARRLRQRLREHALSNGAVQGDLILKVEGVTCQHCVARVKQTLAGFDTVDEAVPSLSSGLVRIRGNHLDATALVGAVEKAGFKAERSSWQTLSTSLPIGPRGCPRPMPGKSRRGIDSKHAQIPPTRRSRNQKPLAISR